MNSPDVKPVSPASMRTVLSCGGDEFTVILENTEIDYALALSKNIIAELNKEPFTWESNSFEIGTSIGIVSINKETQ